MLVTPVLRPTPVTAVVSVDAVVFDVPELEPEVVDVDVVVVSLDVVEGLEDSVCPDATADSSRAATASSAADFLILTLVVIFCLLSPT
jgi:hypothetical protein